MEKKKVKGKAGRPKKLETAGPGQLTALLQESVKNTLKLKVNNIVSDEEIKTQCREILARCLELQKIHFNSISIEQVTVVSTPNGPKKMTVGGFPQEDIQIINSTMKMLTDILMGDASLPDKNQDIGKMFKQYYQPILGKKEENHEQ